MIIVSNSVTRSQLFLNNGKTIGMIQAVFSGVFVKRYQTKYTKCNDPQTFDEKKTYGKMANLNASFFTTRIRSLFLLFPQGYYRSFGSQPHKTGGVAWHFVI